MPVLFLFIFTAVSYNRPKLCALASWDPNAITFANQTMIGFYPSALFINTDDAIYIRDNYNNRIQIWVRENISSVTTISGAGNGYSLGLFVTSEGDIYVDNGYYNGQVDKWSINATNRTAAMYVTQSCNGLFVDINNTLYCSLGNLHQVVIKSLDDISNTPRIIAGTGCCGSALDRLCYPQGIFVDINFSLYVADSNNDRIQLIQGGQPNATTVAGSRAPGTITLSWPTSVVLDAGWLSIYCG